MATVDEMVADFLAGKDDPPLWTILPGESQRPWVIDQRIGLDAAALRELLDTGASEDLYNSTVRCVDEELLAPLRREDVAAPPVRIQATAHFLRDARTLFGSDRPAIVTSQGLDLLLLALSIPVASLFVERDRDSRSIGTRQAIDLIAHQLGWMTSVAARPHGQPVFPDEQQRDLALDIYLAAKRFILLHELAHVVRHAGGQAPEVGLPPSAGSLEPETWSEELEADEVALRMGLSAGPSCSIDARMQWTGVVLFLTGQRWLEAFSPTPKSETHPSPDRRLASLEASPQLRGEAQLWAWDTQLRAMLRDIETGVDGGGVLGRAPDAVMFDGRTVRETWSAHIRQLLSMSVTESSSYDAFADLAENLIDISPSVVLAEINAMLAEARARHNVEGAEKLALERQEQLLVVLASRLPPDVQLALGVNALR